MLPLCADQRIGVLPWSPLARGRLTRPWDEHSARSATDEFGQTLYRDDDRPIVDAVTDIATRRGVPRAQIALAWVLHNPVVSAPLIGATKPQHLEDAVAASALTLSDEEAAALEASYTPHAAAGFN
jgi:aryl-alcohol dehydrogenase (NADP+)